MDLLLPPIMLKSKSGHCSEKKQKEDKISTLETFMTFKQIQKATREFIFGRSGSH